jgi:hypothetical protein
MAATPPPADAPLPAPAAPEKPKKKPKAPKPIKRSDSVLARDKQQSSSRVTASPSLSVFFIVHDEHVSLLIALVFLMACGMNGCVWNGRTR